ncbi:hypothetical protein LTS03_012003 [Exophiala xenobiotica]|nr:hypothetical protein LTS03_012003 [Exophiala xenobiotica]
MPPLPSPKAAIHLPLPHPSANLELPAPFVTADSETNTNSHGAVSHVSGSAEATASAALTILTNDWRGAGATAAASVEPRVGTMVTEARE